MVALNEIDELATPALLGFVREIPEPNEFQGTRWLPNKTIDTLDFEYILGQNQTPVMATFMGWDASTPLHARQAAGEKIQGELPPVKRMARWGEKTLARLETPRLGTNDVAQGIIDVLQVTADLVRSIQARAEWARMQALSEDKILYSEDGVIFEFDFGITEELQINLITQTDGTGAALGTEFGPVWTDHANSTPHSDLAAINRRARLRHGRGFTEFVAPIGTIDHILQSDALREVVRGTGAPTAPLTLEEVNVILRLLGAPEIVEYSTVVQAETDAGGLVTVYPMAQNKGFFVPEGGPVLPGMSSIGSTLWGPTAESRELIGTPLTSQRPGIFAKAFGKEDPPAEYVKAAAVLFPSMPAADKIGQMTLWAPS